MVYIIGLLLTAIAELVAIFYFGLNQLSAVFLVSGVLFILLLIPMFGSGLSVGPRQKGVGNGVYVKDFPNAGNPLLELNQPNVTQADDKDPGHPVNRLFIICAVINLIGLAINELVIKMV